MTKVNQIYQCSVCGNVVSVIIAKAGTLVCCGQEMNLLEEKSGEEGLEKHKPVMEINGNKVTVKVGSIDHPMEENHYIELIQILSGEKIITGVRLGPGDKPQAEFTLNNTKGIRARALCNLHGLWRNE